MTQPDDNMRAALVSTATDMLGQLALWEADDTDDDADELAATASDQT